MLKTLRDAFKIKALRQKILFTFAMLVVVRIGSQLPVPGINGDFFQSWFKSTTDGAFNFFDAITGGSFLNMSILALNITPYITSSIIMQLLTMIMVARLYWDIINPADGSIRYVTVDNAPRK